MAVPLQSHSPQAALLLNMAQHIRAYERRPVSEHVALQYAQLHKLLCHARQYSPFWLQRLAQTGFDPARLDRTILHRLPILQRAEVQNDAERLRTHGMTLPVVEKLWERIPHPTHLPSGCRMPVAFPGDELGKLRAIQAFRILQHKSGEEFLRLDTDFTEVDACLSI